MQEFRADPGTLGVGYPVIGKNSEAFAEGDGVYIDANGFLAKATTSSKILGYATSNLTMDSDNQTVDKVKPGYVYAGDVEMIIGSDQDAVQTDIGAYADYGTITSGAQELNLVAGTTGQFLVVGFDPYETGDDDQVVVVVAEPQRSAFAQA